MIIVTGAVQASPETFDDLLAVCLAHVHRSRAEAGCISHAVHRDVEDPLRLVFFEEWDTLDALRVHFAQSGSIDFMTSARRLAAKAEPLRVFEAKAIKPPS